jgi:hypothetical protein
MWRLLYSSSILLANRPSSYNSQEYNFKATNEECIDLTIYFIKESKTNHDG